MGGKPVCGAKPMCGVGWGQSPCVEQSRCVGLGGGEARVWSEAPHNTLTHTKHTKHTTPNPTHGLRPPHPTKNPSTIYFINGLEFIPLLL